MPPEAPKVLGRYALYGQIAAGGMATVHFGRLIGPVGFSRTVAIKRLHPHLALEPEFATLLLDEARLAGRVRHPHVVQTVDVVAAEGELFIVMEYVQGESLARLLRLTKDRRERVPPAIGSAILSGCLHGLHAAHDAKGDRGEPLDIVHRDVSPQNIVVGTDGLARVLDFGVAKAASRLLTTREGQIKGKLAYMAPEQVRAGTVSRRTDVYAASVVLWEVLTGRRLFSGENDGMVLEQVLLGVVDPPSSVATGVPGAFDAIVLRGVERDPSKRFATAREMALALERACPPALPSQVGEWLERVAGDELKERAAKVVEIESTPSWEAEPLSQRSTLSVSKAGSMAKVSGKRWRALSLLLGLLGGGLLAMYVARRHGGAPAIAAGPLASSFDEEGGAITAASPPSAGPDKAAAPESAAASVSAAPPLSSGATRAVPARRARDCNPPYTRDANGRILWKRQCI